MVVRSREQKSGVQALNYFSMVAKSETKPSNMGEKFLKENAQ